MRYDLAKYWGEDTQMNNYCNLIKGMYIQFDLSFPQYYVVDDGGIQLCFHESNNSYGALDKEFYISDYLSDKTWPTEIGKYISPDVTKADIFGQTTKGF